MTDTAPQQRALYDGAWLVATLDKAGISMNTLLAELKIPQPQDDQPERQRPVNRPRRKDVDLTKTRRLSPKIVATVCALTGTQPPDPDFYRKYYDTVTRLTGLVPGLDPLKLGDTGELPSWPVRKLPSRRMPSSASELTVEVGARPLLVWPIRQGQTTSSTTSTAIISTTPLKAVLNRLGSDFAKVPKLAFSIPENHGVSTIAAYAAQTIQDGGLRGMGLDRPRIPIVTKFDIDMFPVSSATEDPQTGMTPERIGRRQAIRALLRGTIDLWNGHLIDADSMKVIFGMTPDYYGSVQGRVRKVNELLAQDDDDAWRRLIDLMGLSKKVEQRDDLERQIAGLEPERIHPFDAIISRLSKAAVNNKFGIRLVIVVDASSTELRRNGDTRALTEQTRLAARGVKEVFKHVTRWVDIGQDMSAREVWFANPTTAPMVAQHRDVDCMQVGAMDGAEQDAVIAAHFTNGPRQSLPMKSLVRSLSGAGESTNIDSRWTDIGRGLMLP